MSLPHNGFFTLTNRGFSVDNMVLSCGGKDEKRTVGGSRLLKGSAIRAFSADYQEWSGEFE